jgi:hypothetical protein
MKRRDVRRDARGTRAMKAYRLVSGSAPCPVPSASMDARILAAARQSASRSPERRQLLFVGAMAATVMMAFTARWLTQDSPLSDSRSFGLAEGQSRDYLLQFDPLTTGPGSQEGLP